MKPQPQLAEMIKGQMFDGFLLTRTATQRTSVQRQQISGHDAVRSSPARSTPRCGTATRPRPTSPTVLRVRGMMTGIQRPAAAARGQDARWPPRTTIYDMSALAPCAPQPASEMLDYILNRVDAFARFRAEGAGADAAGGVRRQAELLSRRLQAAPRRALGPAAPHQHHAAHGGHASARSIPRWTPTCWPRA